VGNRFLADYWGDHGGAGSRKSCARTPNCRSSSPLCGRHRRGSQAARLRLHQTARNFEITALVFARKDGEEWVSRRSKIQEQVVLYVEFGDLDSFDVLWKVP
jgi:hypothetical protein